MSTVALDRATWRARASTRSTASWRPMIRNLPDGWGEAAWAAMGAGSGSGSGSGSSGRMSLIFSQTNGSTQKSRAPRDRNLVASSALPEGANTTTGGNPSMSLGLLEQGRGVEPLKRGAAEDQAGFGFLDEPQGSGEIVGQSGLQPRLLQGGEDSGHGLRLRNEKDSSGRHDPFY